MKIIIEPVNKMYYAQCQPVTRGHWVHAAYGVSPRQALQRVADKANLHGSTVEVSVIAPCKARLALRRAFPLANS